MLERSRAQAASQSRWRSLGRSAWQTCTASLAMAIACGLIAYEFPLGSSWQERLESVALPVGASLAVYFTVAGLFRMTELGELFPAAAGSDETG